MKAHLLRSTVLIGLTTIILSTSLHARQGMWIPSLLKQLNEEDLKELGLTIPVEELFSSAGGGLNDAIVQFGGGCTGEVVSDSGLLFTNHHCGYGQLQSLSSLANNYVRDGFWAKNRSEELPCPGLTVTFVRDIRSVTDVFKSLGIEQLDEAERDTRVKAISDSLEAAAAMGDFKKANVKSFFNGNEYYLFITEVYRDVRLVGAPPSTIGNFGGETDNWVWPRHTGDFTIFRIYADSVNRPSDYSASNRPYLPGRSLSINLSGPSEGAFTMVYGFPGRTQQFLTSSSIKLISNQTNPERVALRELRMDVWKKAMAGNDTIQLQYASKFRSLANAYKKWKGEKEGLEKADAVAMKSDFENVFEKWAADKPEYRDVVKTLNAAVDSSYRINKVYDYYSEGLSGIEILSVAARIRPLIEKWRSGNRNTADLQTVSDKVAKELTGFYKNYSAQVDRQAASELLRVCDNELAAPYRPDFLDAYRKDPVGFLNRLYSNSVFVEQKAVLSLLKSISPKSIRKLLQDPAWIASQELSAAKSEEVEPELNSSNARINSLQRTYTKGQLEMKKGIPVAPDANSTLRVSYGKVEGMRPGDGVRYDWYTTTNGILEKCQTGEPDYELSDRLKDIYSQAGKSEFAAADGQHTAFLAFNHTTGGNSGSPVLDHKGRLIGINFDRIWEGVMSDLYFYDKFSRNISVDIRYVLFVIKEVGNAPWLFEEMKFEK